MKRKVKKKKKVVSFKGYTLISFLIPSQAFIIISVDITSTWRRSNTAFWDRIEWRQIITSNRSIRMTISFNSSTISSIQEYCSCVSTIHRWRSWRKISRLPMKSSWIKNWMIIARTTWRWREILILIWIKMKLPYLKCFKNTLVILME